MPELLRPSERDDDIPPKDLLLDTGNLRLLESAPAELVKTVAMPTLPAPPVGTTFHFGARDRLVGAAARCKKSPKYNPTVEGDLLIETPDQAPQVN